ncbi:MAG: thioredoxin domain-containing protein [bacterium]
MNKENLKIPIAIVLAGALIALAVYFSNIVPQKSLTPTAKDNSASLSQTFSFGPISPINAKDQVLGNPNADLTFVVYSDMQCPYCKSYHVTMKKIVDNYAKDGKVALVVRNLPLSSIHPFALPSAIASECVAKLGGADKYWKYVDSAFAATLDSEDTIINLAVKAGVKKDDISVCMKSDDISSLVKTQSDEMISATGGRIGTPHTIVFLKEPLTTTGKNNINLMFSKIGGDVDISADSKEIGFAGNIPFELMKLFVDTATKK